MSDRPSHLPAELGVDETRTGVVFHVHVTPGARKPGIGGLHGDALRLAVRSRPVDGAANADSARAIAKALSVRPRDVRIPPGSRSRRKRVEVDGDPVSLRALLLSLAQRGALR